MTFPGLEGIVKAQEEALERARTIAKVIAQNSERLPELLRDQKVAERDRLNLRIERLVAEGDRIAARFAAEIERQREALTRVDAEIAKLEPKEVPSKPRKKRR
jgi:hypothetical protein